MKEVNVALTTKIIPVKALNAYIKNAQKVKAQILIFVFLPTLEHIVTIKLK